MAGRRLICCRVSPARSSKGVPTFEVNTWFHGNPSADRSCSVRDELGCKLMKALVRPEGLEPPAYWFEASRSIQLSYGRTVPSVSVSDHRQLMVRTSQA